MTETELKRSATKREQVARALPYMAAAAAAYVWIPYRGLFEHAAYTVFGGLVFGFAGLLASAVATFSVAKVAGKEPDMSNDLRATATALLFIAVYAFGLHNSERRVRRILRCVDDPETRGVDVVTGIRPTTRDLIRWCDSEYPKGPGPADDE